MNREKANEILINYGRPSMTNDKGTTIVFARQSYSDIESIENLTNEEIVKTWKSLVWMNYIYGQVSLNELQRIDLIELEMEDREIEEDLEKWYQEALMNFNINEEI